MSGPRKDVISAGSRHADDDVRDEKVLVTAAAAGFANEKELGPLAALRAYPWAVVWSIVMALCVIMEGYDTALLGSFFAYRMFFFPAFWTINPAAYPNTSL